MVQRGRRAPTHREKNPNARLSPEQIQSIRTRYANGGVSQEALAKEHGVSQRNISFIVRGETWT